MEKLKGEKDRLEPLKKQLDEAKKRSNAVEKKMKDSVRRWKMPSEETNAVMISSHCRKLNWT